MDDEFVGVCHAVIAGVAPDLKVIDITHGIPPHDVRGGALALLRAVQYLPDGAVVLAVVDPGVGTDRLGIALRTEHRFYVGPDNGLLSPAVAMEGGALEAVVLDSDEHRLPTPGGATFDGRDVFAPAAAFLATGMALHELGTAIDPVALLPLLLPLPGVEPGGGLAAQVLWIDRFGNAQLNVSPDELVEIGAVPGEQIEVTSSGISRLARWEESFGHGEQGELLVVVDSYGLVAVVARRGRAIDALPLLTGAGVTLRVT